MPYPFGQDFTYTFQPLLDGETISGIPAQTASLYVYDSKPSRTAAMAGTGAVAGPISGSWTLNATSCSFTIPGIDDPDPDAQTEAPNYWVSVSFKLTTGEQTQYVVRFLDMERVTAHDKPVSVTYSDLQVLSPGITAYAGNSEQTAQIAAVTALVRARLLNRGYEWAELSRPDRLNDTVKFMALSQIYQSKMQRPGDQFDKLYQDYARIAEELFQALKIEYDAEKEGEPESEIQPGSFGIILR